MLFTVKQYRYYQSPSNTKVATPGPVQDNLKETNDKFVKAKCKKECQNMIENKNLA
jgi:hypothetical protein